MCKITFLKISIVLAGLLAVAASEHLFESLLQRRAKPIRWKWSNDLDDLNKPHNHDVQRRRRFLLEPAMEKWWRTMVPKKDETPVEPEKENQEETYFRRPTYGSNPKFQHLSETSVKENEGVLVINSTRTFREEASFQNRHSPFGHFETLSLPVEPFEKDNHVIVAAHYLSPTEKTFFDEQRYPDAFGTVQNIPPERGVENDNSDDNRNNQERPYVQQHDVDSELLGEVIIHERHKPSKFEIQTASQRLKDSGNILRPAHNKQSMPSVEYIVPHVENVISQVEYADNSTDTAENQTPDVLSTVEYVTPEVEFVNPEIQYSPAEYNSSWEPESLTNGEEIWVQEIDNDAENESSSQENKFRLQNYENEDVKIENDGTRLKIVALRREQIRVRRNKGKSQQATFGNEHYPTLEALPVVQFYCGDYMPGYYVDITTRCQVFHICHENGQRSSFLCPVGTVFNQEYLVCDWWYNVDCERSPKYYNSLEMYSTSAEKEKILSQTELTDSEYNAIKKKISARGPYDQIRNKYLYTNQKSPPRYSDLSQKVVNYPVGYAILLREYMKSTMVSEDKDKNHIIYYRNDKDETDANNGQFIIDENPAVEKYEKETRTKSSPKHYDTITHNTGGSKPYTIVPSSHSQNKKSGQKLVLEDVRPFKSHNSKPFVPLTENHKVRNKPSHGKIVSLEKETKSTKLEKEEPQSFYDSHKKENSNSRKSGQNNQVNSKNLFKSTKDLHRYHFIIDPKQAIRPASEKQYSILEQHNKNNGTAIKFRHAESIIKHIPPQNNKASFTLKSKNTNREDKSRVEYSSPVSFSSDHHLASNSDPSISKTLNPILSSGYRYGDRIHTNSKVIFSSNGQVNTHLPKTKERNISTELENPQRKRKYDNINQIKRNLNQNNHSYSSELQQSESSRFNIANFNRSSDKQLLNKKKSETAKNITEYFYLPMNKDLENKNLNKQKITISVRIERKAVLPDNNSVPSNEEVSMTSLNNETTILKKPVLPSNYQEAGSDNHIIKSSNMMYNLSSNENLNKIVQELNSRNTAKINSTYSSSIIANHPSIFQNKSQGIFLNNYFTTVNKTSQNQQMNASMHFIFD